VSKKFERGRMVDDYYRFFLAMDKNSRKA